MNSTDAHQVDRPGSSRRVSFLGKCQVILPVEYPSSSDNAVEDYFTQRNAVKANKQKGRLHLFRSKKNRSWSESEHEQSRHRSKRITSPPPQIHTNRSNSAPLGALPLSPSLPISRDGTANRLRQKLVSPPPPTSVEAQSPISRLRKPTDSPSVQSTPSSPILAAPTIADIKAPLARPVAVRKPLTFGFDKDDDQERDMQSKLQCPPIIYVSSLPKQTQSDNAAKGEQKPSVLNWKDEADESASPSSSSADLDDDDDEEDEAWMEGQYEEEDLHGECTCLDCEQKMVAALSPGYQPQWTRGARRKYLADRKEAQSEQSKKAVRPPIWLTSEESEAAAAASPISEAIPLPFSPPATIREICADEIDGKKGAVRKVTLPRNVGVDVTNGGLVGAEAASEDAKLRKEVEDEVRLREEEQRSKKTRSEMRKLSADLGSGLRLGGGGARAMMRQLEEAEQAERRARFERSRSPKFVEEQLKEESIPIGAAIATTSVSPPARIASPIAAVDQPKPLSPALANVKEKPSRTPSPLRRALSLGKSSDSKVASPAAMKQDTSTEVIGRHPSPSLLIRRELALGIPVQSHGISNGKGRQSWHNSPKGSGSPAIEPVKTPLKTPSPHLTALNESANDVDEEMLVKSAPDTLQNMTKHGMSRSYSMQATTSGSTRKNRSASDEQPKKSAEVTGQDGTDLTTTAKPGFDSLRRSNTTGSRRVANGANLAPSSSVSSAALFNNSTSSSQNLLEARLDKAKAKARLSFRDLVARIKG